MGKNTLRSLFVLELLKQTDENHPLTAGEIVEKLDCVYGLSAERKAVCRDVNDLISCGYDIIQHDNQKRGWYMLQDFELWELKVLSDAVQSAKFLNQSDTDKIIKKLQALTGADGRRALRLMNIPADAKRGTPITKRVISGIFEAIQSQEKVRFNYVHTIYQNAKRQTVPKHREGTEPVSPYALIWRKDKYYLIGSYDGKKLSYYRLDRIEAFKVIPEPAVPLRDILGSDENQKLREFVKRNIYNSKGETIRLRLRINTNDLDTVLDSFGDEVAIFSADGHTIDANVSVSNSRGLYTWLTHHLADCEVLQPLSVRQELRRRLQQALDIYGD